MKKQKKPSKISNNEEEFDELTSAIIDELKVDEDGKMYQSTTLDVAELEKAGVEDINSFISGVIDAETDKEFNSSEKDYIKGYQYGKTRKITTSNGDKPGNKEEGNEKGEIQ